MNVQRLTTWLHDFTRESKGLVVSMAVLFLGALPLYIYALSIGQLPDFSMADLTGVLIASFLTEAFLGAAMVVYLLFAGLAARKTVNGFYPPRAAVPPAGPSPVPIVSNSYEYLIKGNFILGVTIFSLLAWFGIATKSFDRWLSPENPGLVRCIYAASLVSAAVLVLADWRRGGRKIKYALFAILAGSTAFVAVLLAAYLNGYVAAPRVAASRAAQSFGAEYDATKVVAWLLRDRLVLTAWVTALIVAVGVLIILGVTRHRRSIGRTGAAPRPFIRNEAVRLIAAKVAAALVFTALTALSMLFLGIIVDASPIHRQTMVEFMGGGYLIMLNWFAFAARDWKTRIVLGVGTFAIVFVMVPLYSDNPTLLPRMVVRSLGIGNLHASSIALSGLQCSTLAPYGVDCDPKKDTSIGITNVNILNRLGSTVLVELQVKRTTGAAVVPQKMQPGSQASGTVATSVSPVEFRTLTLHDAPGDKQTERQVAVWYPCSSFLLERLRADDPHKADELACVKLSVPKEQILGNTTNGAATYSGGFSQYIRTSDFSSRKGG